jgi:hypothetical protein
VYYVALWQKWFTRDVLKEVLADDFDQKADIVCSACGLVAEVACAACHPVKCATCGKADCDWEAVKAEAMGAFAP